MPTALRLNPYWITCPCCDRYICYRCARYEDALNGLGKGDGNGTAQRWSREYRRHRATYDHLLESKL